MRIRSTARGAALSVAAVLALGAGTARADAVDTLREFAREAKSGRASFTQTVTSPDGAKTRTSRGQFEFARPNRFRFAYAKPFEQLIVGDGQKVWLYDPDLQQATSRPIGAALGSTPASLLAGGALERDFELATLPDAQGLQWARATPRATDSGLKSMRVGFRGKSLAAVEIVDAFGQTSVLRFDDVATNVALPPQTFRFTPPAGVDVIEQ